MSYKPSDFFVDITDFFGVLLPGAVLAFWGKCFAAENVFNGSVLPPLSDGTESWIAFAIASYVLGHMVAILGGVTAAIGDHVFNPIFERAQGPRRTLSARSKALAADIFKPYGTLEPDVLRAYVRLKDGGTASVLDRMAAVTRFFRTLSMVLLLFILAHLTDLTVTLSGLAIWVFLVWLYSYQRWRHNAVVHASFIALHLDSSRQP